MARGFKKPKVPKGPRYTEAEEEVLTLAARLIDDEHNRLSGLAEAKISYWMVNGAWNSGGESVDGNLQLITGPSRKETGYVFRVLLNAKTWEAADAKYKAYMLHTQLARCGRGETGSGEVRWFKRAFPVQVAPEVVSRYGCITEPLRQLKAALQQLELEFDKAA